jgi:hypothetical protein
MPLFTPKNEELSPEPTEKGVLATDKTDDYRTNFIFLAPTKTGPERHGGRWCAEFREGKRIEERGTAK